MTELLRSTALDQEIDYFGIADLSPARESIRQQGGERIAALPFAISVGVAMDDDIVNRLTDPPDRPTAELYRARCYRELNRQLEIHIVKLARALLSEGHAAVPIPPTVKRRGVIVGVFPHKTAAALAGLGWIGKNNLLITPDRGPRVRFATVLTNAPLEPTGEAMIERCGDCTVCVDTCPVNAIVGRAFNPDEDVAHRLRTRLCRNRLRWATENIGVRVCALCVKACPYGAGGGTSPSDAGSGS